MRFTEAPRRAPSENMVPMINVVFLLLIFFLMTAQIAPPEPFEVTPPEAAETEQPVGEFTLYLSPEAELGFRDALGEEAALAALEAERAAFCAAEDCEGEAAPPLTLRADQGVPATELAKLLPKLGALGFSDVELVTATN
ncbi:biopolymer transport protein ExbD [Poseidonocella pacifica]|uniref:Biopolymer transport protein ExbD n=1 Tax=Poseidonocella pacifica TaxID=871651 RepID=A0A1I0VGX4_9RHOB|nr:biopolymer transporter ExbD [Poseidonocella pacifica]SFA75624.1 biopolymer transport protein ExbD [Poseidonocella pacifica]